MKLDGGPFCLGPSHLNNSLALHSGKLTSKRNGLGVYELKNEKKTVKNASPQVTF